jgi:RND superfamily putative drug exporter
LASRDVPVPTALTNQSQTWTTRVESGQVHAVLTSDAVAGSAALLLATGRLRPAGGWLKALGFVLPGRSGAVRRRSVYLDLAASANPVTALQQALAEQPSLLALDGAERLAGEVRSQLQTVLRLRDPGLTVLVAAPEIQVVAQLITPNTHSLIASSSTQEVQP